MKMAISTFIIDLKMPNHDHFHWWADENGLGTEFTWGHLKNGDALIDNCAGF